MVSTFVLKGVAAVDPRIDGITNFPGIMRSYALTNQDHNHPLSILLRGYFSYGNVDTNRSAWGDRCDYDNTINPICKNITFRVYRNGSYTTYNNNGRNEK